MPHMLYVILNEVKDLILPQSAFADSSLKEGAIENSSLTFRMTRNTDKKACNKSVAGFVLFTLILIKNRRNQ